MHEAVSKEKPDHIIHLGDYSRDAEELRRRFPEIPMDIVKGNNDFMSGYPVSKLLVIDGKRLFITHGDQYGVKNGVERIADKGKDESADIVLFGHTHIPYLFIRQDMWIMNPGTIGLKSFFSPKATYGAIEIAGGKIRCEIKEV